MGTGSVPGSFDENRGAARSRCWPYAVTLLDPDQATLRIARLPGLLASPSLSPEWSDASQGRMRAWTWGWVGWYVADGSYSARISLILQCVTGGRCAPQDSAQRPVGAGCFGGRRGRTRKVRRGMFLDSARRDARGWLPGRNKL